MRNQARQLDENQDKTHRAARRLEPPAPGNRSATPRSASRPARGSKDSGSSSTSSSTGCATRSETPRKPSRSWPRSCSTPSARRTSNRSPKRSSDAEQLVDLGVAEEAVKSSRRAGQGIEQLREGVERSARSVLGDETAALRRAQGELEDLADQVNREIAQATGREPSARPGRNGQGQNDPTPATPQRPGSAAKGSARRTESSKESRGSRRGQPAGTARAAGTARPAKGPARTAKGPARTAKGSARPTRARGQRVTSKDKRDSKGAEGTSKGKRDSKGRGPCGVAMRAGATSNNPASRQQGGGGGALDRMLDGITRGGPGGPITGEGFRQWSDRMRDVEELLDNPELRAEAARIRDRARGAREEFKRHSKVPDWKQLQDLVSEPMNELRNRIAEEVRRRESPDALVPIDRDPVPPQFAEGVRRYYERLGSGQ